MKTRVTAAALSAVLLVALAGCTAPEPAEPTPTPAFASDDEAFAAAEDTYRAYVDALNQVDLSDPETFEAVYEWMTADANAEARKGFSEMHADGWAVRGSSEVTVVKPRVAGGADHLTVELAVCLDVSGIALVDAEGNSVVSNDRPDVQTMLVTLEESRATDTGLAISLISAREGEPRCQ